MSSAFEVVQTMPRPEDDFRITYNGYEYRVEELRFTFWRNTPYWNPVKYAVPLGGSYIKHFPDIRKAEDAISDLKRYTARLDADWKPVTE